MESNITYANENKLAQSTYSEALTAFSSGWNESKCAELLDFIAPAVPVGRRFEFKRANNAEAFFSESDDVRSIGSEFKRVRYGGDTVNEKTLNKGLTMRVDHDEIADDNWQERYTALLLERLMRNELRRAVSALEAISTFPESDTVWDPSDSVNTDADLRSMLALAADESGVRPNRILFGEDAWSLRMECLENQNNSLALKSGAFTPDELGEKLLVEGCKVVSSRYQISASAKARIAADKIFAFCAFDGVSKDEPSNLKRFYTPTSEGTPFRVYLDERAKYTDITVEHYSTIVAASAVGARGLTVKRS